MKKITITAATLSAILGIQSSFAQVSTYDVGFYLRQSEKFYTKYLKTERDMNDLAKIEALKTWIAIQSKKDPRFNSSILRIGRNAIKSQSTLQWLAHYQLTGQNNEAASVLGAYYSKLAGFIFENANDPRAIGDQKKLSSVVNLAFSTAEQVDSCAKSTAATVGNNLFGLSQLIEKCITSNSNTSSVLAAVQTVLGNKRYTGNNQMMSATGYIPGNKVEQITQNYYEADFINYLAPMTATVQKNYSQMTVEDFKAKMTDKKQALDGFFTATEGFPTTPKDHRVWDKIKSTNGRKNIYGDVFESLSQAQESIFIDMFFIGGSVGASLAKHLITQLQQKPNLHVYIINDRNNPLGYNSEMAPVYNYLKAYSEKFPEDRLVVTTPRIDLKLTSMPPFVDLLLSDATLKTMLNDVNAAGLKTQLTFYPKGKSDHSKVIVIDAKNPATGIAYVGSKNYTDSSGAVAYDEVTKIQGPAVPIIQDSYYYDTLEALKQSLPQLSEGQIRQLIAPIDMLNRANPSKAANTKYNLQGTTPIMIGENNVYGTIRSAQTQDIAAIYSAQKQIIISDQFLYDPAIIRALRDVVLAKPQLRVYVMLTPMDDVLNPTKKFAHIPNIVFVDDLKSTNHIDVRWKKVPAADELALNQVYKTYGVTLAPEYHLKSVSVDGVTRDNVSLCGTKLGQSLLEKGIEQPPILISGSANKDNMTMLGGFREFQVAVYDKQASITHDCQFWERFLDDKQSSEIDVQTMNLPEDLIKQGLDHKSFIQIVKDALIGSYNYLSGYYTN